MKIGIITAMSSEQKQVEQLLANKKEYVEGPFQYMHLYLCYAGYHPGLLLLSCYSTVIKNTARMVLVKS